MRFRTETKRTIPTPTHGQSERQCRPGAALLAAASIDCKIYAIGGFQDGGLGLIDRLEIYDPVTDTWTIGAPMPTARTNLGCVAANGLLFAVGGAGTMGPTDALEVYDPQSDAWTILTPMPTPRLGCRSRVSRWLSVRRGRS